MTKLENLRRFKQPRGKLDSGGGTLLTMITVALPTDDRQLAAYARI